MTITGIRSVGSLSQVLVGTLWACAAGLWTQACGDESSNLDTTRQVPIVTGGGPATTSPGFNRPGAAGAGAAPIAVAGSNAPAPVGAPAAPGGVAGAAAVVGWCDVQPILRTNCQNCHAAQPLYGAPMPLMTHADLLAPSRSDPTKPVFMRVSERIHDAQKPMPPPGQPAFSAQARATLDVWIGAGASEGDKNKCSAPAEPTPGPGAGTPTVSDGRAITSDEGWPEDCANHYSFLARAASGGKYTVTAGQQIYAQVNIPSPWGSAQVQSIRFKPIIDNKKILHHFILYGPNGSFIDGWAPGQAGVIMPASVGMQMPNGNYRLELHYNNAMGTQSEQDASGVEMCVPKTPRPNTAAVHEFGSMLVNVPAHGTQNLVSTCKPTKLTAGPVHMLELHPHMHKTGSHAKMVLKRASGEEIVLHDAAFSFEDQRKYILPEDGSAADVLVNAGDTLTTTCTFTNNGNTPLRWGVNTEDEMCFIYAIAWPIGQLTNGSIGPEGEPNACL